MKLMRTLFAHNRLSSVNLPSDMKQNYYAARSVIVFVTSGTEGYLNSRVLLQIFTQDMSEK